MVHASWVSHRASCLTADAPVSGLLLWRDADPTLGLSETRGRGRVVTADRKDVAFPQADGAFHASRRLGAPRRGPRPREGHERRGPNGGSGAPPMMAGP